MISSAMGTSSWAWGAARLAYGTSGRGEIFLANSNVDAAVLNPFRQALKIDEILAESIEPYRHSYRADSTVSSP
jgi:hypothetical protein